MVERLIGIIENWGKHTDAVHICLMAGIAGDEIREIINRWKVPCHDLIDQGALKELREYKAK